MGLLSAALLAALTSSSAPDVMPTVGDVERAEWPIMPRNAVVGQVVFLDGFDEDNIAKVFEVARPQNPLWGFTRRDRERVEIALPRHRLTAVVRLRRDRYGVVLQRE